MVSRHRLRQRLRRALGGGSGVRGAGVRAGRGAGDDRAGAPARFPKHDLPGDRFDGIFSMEVFYYLPDLDAALAETLRLLRPGGRFACAVDYYGENTASHGWPADLGVEMTLLDAAGWRNAFLRAGFAAVTQNRIRIAATDPRDTWKAAEGSLLTIGARA
jgi:SAM-dependent methyltransferase